MFDTSTWFRTMRTEVLEQNEDWENGTMDIGLVLRVELGLRLLERLADNHPQFNEEPITALWILLSGMPLPDPKLEYIDEHSDMSRMLANARLLVPFSGRFRWEDSLRKYAQIEDTRRAYRVEPRDLDSQLIGGMRRGNLFGERMVRYDHALDQSLTFRENQKEMADIGLVRFSITPFDAPQQTLNVELTNRINDFNSLAQMESFDLSRRQRQPITVRWDDLRLTAEELDRRSAHNGEQTNWVERIDAYLHYRVKYGEEFVSGREFPFTINGVTHVAGMVGSGKSTLMKLLAADAVLNHQGKRHITLVVGDGMSVLDLVNELNNLLADEDHPVAVPVLGPTTRHKHLQRLHSATNSDEHHWGYRWLDTACPLMGFVPMSQMVEISSGLIPGREPCERIDVSSEDAQNPRYKSCPLFWGCPSRRLYHEMPNTQIWVTTPGTMASSTTPSHLNIPRLKIGELIYFHSDLVIFDEVETVMSWFDDDFAQEVRLRGGDNAVFDQAERATVEPIVGRPLSSHENRWVLSVRRTTEAINNILDQLNDPGLQFWVRSRYFTSFNLFNSLSRRLCGLQDWSPEEDLDLDDEIRERLELIRDTYFDPMTEGDPLDIRRFQEGEESEPILQLSRLMGDAALHGVSYILDGCIDWIRAFVPEFEDSLEELNEGLRLANRHEENITTLARKLAFSLMVCLLDRNIRIAFYEWYNQPQETLEELEHQPYRRSVSALTDILPIPPTGRIFGTYYASDAQDENQPNILSRLEYVNIGRTYVLHFHKLFSQLGWPGPNVLAMSGTSWLPHSTRWHVNIPPDVLLEPNATHKDAISESTFTFLPQRDNEGVINVSGERDKLRALRRLSRSLTQSQFLIHELNELQRLEEVEEAQFAGMSEHHYRWHDRQRILLLVNSYSQAKEVARILTQRQEQQYPIFFLKRSDDNEDLLFFHAEKDSIERSGIEHFANTSGRILIAPISAIGRGYNILNNSSPRVAAFGSVLFLTRPMPHPYDIQRFAAELNARALQWCQDGTIPAWSRARLSEKAEEFRRYAKVYWRRAETRYGYRSLRLWEGESTDYDPRRDLAATTLGQVIQATGRLLRGGVPFRAYFVDAKWAPNSAIWFDEGDAVDTPENSLLAELVRVFREYVTHPLGIGEVLYEPFEGLLEIENFVAEIPEEN